MTKDAAYFAGRLRETLENETVRYASIQAKHEEMVAAGVDTSMPAPAQSPDFTLAKAEARVARAQKVLDDYLTKHGLEV